MPAPHGAHHAHRGRRPEPSTHAEVTGVDRSLHKRSRRLPANNSDTPLIEPNPSGDSAETGIRALMARIRQQELLAELGVKALQGAPFDELLNETARLTAIGLGVEFCKVLEHIPSTNRLLVRAGVGWDDGTRASCAIVRSIFAV